MSTTGQLNRAVKQVMEERTPANKYGRRPKVLYVTQTDVAPPTIVLFVNRAAYLTETYQRFMINRFRELLPYAEVPIKLLIRERKSAAKLDASDTPRPAAAPAGKGAVKGGGSKAGLARANRWRNPARSRPPGRKPRLPQSRRNHEAAAPRLRQLAERSAASIR